ncbi:response regulator [Microvirga massiliensis]|uniref:response regulator n=1 Tax=Microvirga massiliensis TaxID=1033741 RepID=UPI000ADEBEFD|nr:response regulator [Microvirga massiliensis]
MHGARVFAAIDHMLPGLLARTVLIVEDEFLVRDTIAGALEDAGFAVVEVGTAEEGLDIIGRRPIGVLFTDIRLPGSMDGWRLAEEARRLYPQLPVIYASGYSVEAPRLVPGGVFLRKPYLPSEVIATIEELVGGNPTE